MPECVQERPSSFCHSISTLPSLWREQVDRSAQRPAAIIGSQELSYETLDTRSNQLARLLRRRGVASGMRVAIAADRSAELLISFLAVLKLGAAYVPLDMESPPERLGFILQAATVQAIVAKSTLIARLPAGDAQVIVLDPELALLRDEASAPVEIEIDPASPAYVMFTSGSTGQPKGTVIPHRAVVQLVRGQTYVPFGPDLRLLVVAAPSFDAITFEVWGALLNGAACVIYEPAQMDLDLLEHTIRTGRVTTSFLTARLFNRIVDLQPSVLQTLRHLMVGGEALSPEHVRRAREVLPGVALVNGYGPTECTTFACTYAIPADRPWPGDTVPIGFPLAHTVTEILDDDFHPVAPGADGELWIGGEGLALGYHNEPELTAARFVSLTLPGGAPRTYYRTGDLCRRLPTGEITFLGRRDGQVKVRGFRIELGEIETQLCQHTAVREAGVVLSPGADGTPHLVAFIVPAAEVPAPTAEILRTFLLQRLPAYMVPAHYGTLTALPLTAHGKLDRATLRDRGGAVAPPHHSSRVPATALEHALCAIWREALGDPSLGLDDDFFVCGGDSLLAIQVIANIERMLGRKLPLAALLDAPTVATMAEMLDHTGGDVGQPRLRGFGPGLPLFYLPGLYGYSLMPQDMVRRLEGAGPYCDSLHFPQMRTHSTMEAMASAFVAQIRACHPEGACNLIGYSFGGELAFEVARQLRESGTEVSQVFLLDSRTNQSERQRGPLDAAVALLWYLVRGGLPSRREFWRTRFAKVNTRLRGILARLPLRHRSVVGATRPSIAGNIPLKSPLLRARTRYQPHPVDTQGVLILCTVLPFSLKFGYRSNHDGGWGNLFKRGLIIHRFDCTHRELLDAPASGRVADLVRRHLDESASRSPRSAGV